MVIKIVALLGIWASIFLSGCGLVGYPGQAGMATNGYSKIDMEFLDASGLWTYEVSYDNREGGAGVTAIISRLYPGALTYTSNSRSGPDGTHYRHKEPYQGSTVQMIYMPATGQMIVPPDSQVMILLEQDVSNDEVDLNNIAETNLFDPPAPEVLNPMGNLWQYLRFSTLKLGEFIQGKLHYQVKALHFNNQKLTFDAHISISTNRIQNAIQGNLSLDIKKRLVEFLDTNFPQGFEGELGVELVSTDTLRFPVRLKTLQSFVASGGKITVDQSGTEINEALQRVYR